LPTEGRGNKPPSLPGKGKYQSKSFGEFMKRGKSKRGKCIRKKEMG
jgi:hypothetical protein